MTSFQVFKECYHRNLFLDETQQISSVLFHAIYEPDNIYSPFLFICSVLKTCCPEKDMIFKMEYKNLSFFENYISVDAV